MPLTIGNREASTGMTQAIYLAIDAELRPAMEQQGAGPAAVAESQEAWKRLAFAVARGVIEHIAANMEIVGIQTAGRISATVAGSTGPASPANHQHAVTLTGVQNNVVFTQSNDGTGHVR